MIVYHVDQTLNGDFEAKNEQKQTNKEFWKQNLCFRRITSGKFFIMSTEFDKNISDWSHDCTDHKNGNDFFMSLVKWPKITVKKSQIF